MSEIDDIIEMIKQLPVEEQKALLGNLQEAPKKKVRRKHYKQEAAETPPTQPKIKKLSKPSPTANRSAPKPASAKKAAQMQEFEKGPRPNLFESSDMFNAYQDEIPRDKKRWEGREPTARIPREESFYELKCDKCNQTVVAPESRILFMPGGEYSFTCEDCISKRGGR